MNEKYICNDCKGKKPCKCEMEEVVDPPTQCLFDGSSANWLKEIKEEGFGLTKLFGD